VTLFFYNVALLAATIAGAPWWLWRLARTEKHREGLLERLGKVPKRMTPASAEGARRPILWIHAVSVGEVLAIAQLVKRLDASLPEHVVLVSTTTRTGQALARERFGSNRVFYCPLDFPWAVRGYLNALKPSMLVLAETEFWPNLLSGCFRRGIPVVVVNARISDRSWPRYKRLRVLWRPILSRLSRVLAQSNADAERLRAIGCSPQREAVCGNLKFDIRAATDAEAAQMLRTSGDGLKFVVAGSTLEGEEAALVEAWAELLFFEQRLAMVLAPRHPERFAAVAALLERSGNAWMRRSEWGANPPKSIRPGTIVLLDSIGELASVYSLASVAFVGGSLIPAGGHNPLEPAQFGVPIVMGPHYANFAAITDALRKENALRIAGREDLAAALTDLLSNRGEAEAMGARAREVFTREAGATERCVAAICEVLGVSEGAEIKA